MKDKLIDHSINIYIPEQYTNSRLAHEEMCMMLLEHMKEENVKSKEETRYFVISLMNSDVNDSNKMFKLEWSTVKKGDE